jgi:hypothetical protein
MLLLKLLEEWVCQMQKEVERKQEERISYRLGLEVCIVVMVLLTCELSSRL